MNFDGQVPVAARAKSQDDQSPGLAERVRGAVLWRSGSQIVAQPIPWAGTFLVIRLLDPSDYGLFPMPGVVLFFLNLLNGSDFSRARVQRESINRPRVLQPL